jgi:hypothetical protein
MKVVERGGESGQYGKRMMTPKYRRNYHCKNTSFGVKLFDIAWG